MISSLYPTLLLKISAIPTYLMPNLEKIMRRKVGYSVTLELTL